MPKFIKKSPSQPVGRRNLSAQNISARIGLGAGETPIGEPSTIVGDPCAIVGVPRVIVGEQRALERIAPLPGSQVMITELARDGAKQILAAALEQEIQEYLEQHINLRDEQGHQQVVRNGYCIANRNFRFARPLPRLLRWWHQGKTDSRVTLSGAFNRLW